MKMAKFSNLLFCGIEPSFPNDSLMTPHLTIDKNNNNDNNDI